MFISSVNTQFVFGEQTLIHFRRIQAGFGIAKLSIFQSKFIPQH